VKDFLDALRWLFGIDSLHDTKPKYAKQSSRPRRGKWVTSPSGGWQWMEEPYRDPPEWVLK